MDVVPPSTAGSQAIRAIRQLGSWGVRAHVPFSMHAGLIQDNKLRVM